ncbi:hypothetical protein QL093DRAFT_2105985 [Fusarium oxysporum]|nr:hypothetical protein QL093DRAFT_2105985 [Fusarium oxysporum]
MAELIVRSAIGSIKLLAPKESEVFLPYYENIANLVGKTQIALQFAHEVKEKHPHYSIFWVPTLSDEGVECAYAEIAKRLRVQKTDDSDDVKELVCQQLASGQAGKWLLIVDNADDPDLIIGSEQKRGLE